MPQQMRVDAPGLEAGLVGEAPEDEERSGSRQGPALCVQEELGPVAAVEERTATAEIAAKRIGGAAPQRDDPLLAALADRAHEPLVQVDSSAFEADGLAHPEARAVEQLDEGAVAKVTRLRARGGLDQALGLAR